MFKWIRKQFSGPDLKPLLERKAQIVDVRSPQEYQQGHAEPSTNIPLSTLSAQIKKLDKNRPVITCCRSGNRSGMAARQLANLGFEVVNGGPWQRVQRSMDAFRS